MLVPIYLICGLITTLWSIWLFILWQKKLKFSDTSLMRFLLLLVPVAFFIIIVFSDWSKVVFLRVDIAGLIGITGAALFFWLIQVCTINLHNQYYKPIYIITIAVNQVLNLLLVLFLFSLRSFPLLAVRISAFFESWKDINILKVLWEGLDPEKNEQSLFSLANKIFIALIIYFPLTAVRIWFTNRKFRQLKMEIDNLKDQLTSRDTDNTPFAEAADEMTGKLKATDTTDLNTSLIPETFVRDMSTDKEDGSLADPG